MDNLIFVSEGIRNNNVKKFSKILLADDILNMVANPPVLVPAPSSDSYNVMLAMAVSFRTCNYPLAAIGGDNNLKVFYGDADGERQQFYNNPSAASLSETSAKIHLGPSVLTSQSSPIVSSRLLGMPLVLTHSGVEWTPSISDAITDSTLETSGSGYAPGDTFSVDNGTGAVGQVDEVDESGGVLSYHLTSPGHGYSVGVAGCSVTSGGGDGNFSISINTVSTLCDVSMRVSGTYANYQA